MTLADIDQVLLQRIMSKGVLDREHSGLAVFACGCDLERIVLPVQSRVDAVKLHRYVAEIAQHRIFIGWLHRLMVIRMLPLGVFILVALDTAAGADICGWLISLSQRARI